MTQGKALVSGVAHSFVTTWPIEGATIKALEDPDFECKTDSAGKFGPFEWPIDAPITLICEKEGSFWSGYKTTQASTIIVPSTGIHDEDYLKNITFQVPSNMAYKFILFAVGVQENPELCQIATTVTPPDTNMDETPQGIEGVKVTINPDPGIEPYYFGILPFFQKTNPFKKGLKKTSLDGGVAYFNIPEGEYTLTATKQDLVFSQVEITARKGVLVNASPPNGPTELRPNSSRNSAVFFPPKAISTVSNDTHETVLSLD